MSNIVDMTTSKVNEQKNSVNNVGSDVLASYRPAPVTMGCTQDIPETIQEESESRRESMVDATARKSSLGKKIETLADIAQSSEESGNSATLLSPWVDDNQNGAQNSSFCYSDSDLEVIEMEKIPVSLDVTANNVRPSFKIDNESSADNSCNDTMDEMNALQSNVMSGNSKVKPVQTDTLEKAIGFLLESNSRKRNKHQQLKRVKFNHL